MDALQAELQVLEIEILILKGLRLSPRKDLAAAAVNRERQVQSEIDRLRAQIGDQPGSPQEKGPG